MTCQVAPAVVAGVEGGGTRTQCLIYVPTTGKAGLGRGGPINTNYVLPEEARQSLVDAVRGAAGAAGVDCAAVTHLAAAAPWTEAIVREVLAWLAPGASVLTPGEDRTALAGGTGVAAGVVLTSGTGSRCAYIPLQPELPDIVAGAWGSLFGDEGSGYHIGAAILRAVTRAWDGRGPETGLGALVCRACGLAGPKDLIGWVYGGRPGFWRYRIASLCPLLATAVAMGDPVAVAIAAGAAGDLAAMVAAVMRRAGLNPPLSVLVSGGVFRLGPAILEPLAAELRRLGPVSIRLPELPPVAGAVRLAAAAAGVLQDRRMDDGLSRALASGGRV